MQLTQAEPPTVRPSASTLGRRVDPWMSRMHAVVNDSIDGISAFLAPVAFVEGDWYARQDGAPVGFL